MGGLSEGPPRRSGRAMHRVEIGGLLSGGRAMDVEDEITIEPFEGIAFERPARVRLQLRYAQGALEVRGVVNARARAECDVCLAPVEFDVRADLDERLDPSGNGEADPFGENNVVRGSRLDVADLAQQVLLSALPMGVRCEQHSTE
jgi:uncharacterized metal-binding protein YceD (DUF177 family)